MSNPTSDQAFLQNELPKKKRGPGFWILIVIGGFMSLALPLGIIAAIAIPNYQAFSNKAKQVEAKTLLILSRTALQTSHIETESYISDLSLLNVNSADGGSIRYAFGFVAPFDGPKQLAGTPNYDPNRHWTGNSNPEYLAIAQQICPDCVATKDTFKLIAIGNLDTDEDLDVWIMTHDEKDPVNIQSDL